MTTFSLAAIQDVRRQDRYSLAARALAALALGGCATGPMTLGQFSIQRQPAAPVAFPYRASTVMQFELVGLMIPWMLERFDEDGSVGDPDDYWPEDVVDSEGESVRAIALDLAEGDEIDAYDLIRSAWEEVHAFISREWQTIERLASRLLIRGAVQPEEIPRCVWSEAGAA